jgi:methyl-accepting chemotaxis protein
MVTEVVPVWQRHVEASRAAVEHGISDLLDSFSRLCDGVMAQQGLVLRQLAERVDPGHAHRERLLGQLAESLEQLDALDTDLRTGMAADCAPESAQHRRQTALERIDHIREALALLSQQVAADTRSDHARQDQAVAQASQTLVRLSTRTAKPDIAAGGLSPLRTGIEQDLERVLLGMQFHDRLDQTLGNVARDMQRFTDWMRCNEHASHADAMRWLAELERSYTMQEQRERHHGHPEAAPQGGTVEFF